MSEEKSMYKSRMVETAILTIRGQKVILDADLAGIYGVPTKRLNEQVRRNIERFPEDFMFRLTPQEVTDMRSQFATSSEGGMRSQIATASERRNLRFNPYAFTEHGAIMAANVLNSHKAVQMSVFVVRAFIKMREYLLNRAELEKRLAEIDKTLISHDAALRDVYQKIRPLLLPPADPPPKPIGFMVKEGRIYYKVKAKKQRRK